jgi:hypothetical protein
MLKGKNHDRFVGKGQCCLKLVLFDKCSTKIHQAVIIVAPSARRSCNKH